MTFQVPEGIVFANIDADSGELASGSSKNIIRQAFLEGTEPSSSRNKKKKTLIFTNKICLINLEILRKCFCKIAVRIDCERNPPLGC